ncbi:F0F1 ATP synthase subunit delta [Thermotalea metallivorans]|uniref:ATP synthase subunit delta n=1 Tax=Thermotalea metallivorans TaxID=520762 RepID=A0A140L6T7_9FIRM|nr:F0F1 ATP synthase subunit delta [Thermotalea metallivorans]KXG76262.1 ATP synthase subunit delta, sodium ion specific [Thermotalea metallivorans]
MVELVAKSYAEALFDVALELNQLDQYGAELNFVMESFQQHPEFFELYKTPRISNEEKKRIIEAVFQGKISPEVMNFLKILSDKRRTGVIEAIVKSYHKLVHEHQNIAEALAVTTVPMKDEDKAALEVKLSKMTGKKVILKNEIDTTIIGGMLVRIGDKVIDGTVQGRLNKLKESLAQIIV